MIKNVFARYLTMLVVGGSILGGAAVGLAGMASAATTTQPTGPGYSYAPSVKAHPAPTLGLEGLRAIVRLTRRPVVAIGGVTADNAAEALAAGAHGVAVLSFAACSPDPVTAVRRLREAIEAFRAEGVGRGAR